MSAAERPGDPPTKQAVTVGLSEVKRAAWKKFAPTSRRRPRRQGRYWRVDIPRKGCLIVPQLRHARPSDTVAGSSYPDVCNTRSEILTVASVRIWRGSNTPRCAIPGYQRSLRRPASHKTCLNVGIHPRIKRISGCRTPPVSRLARSNWRRERDSNPRLPLTGVRDFQSRALGQTRRSLQTLTTESDALGRNRTCDAGFGGLCLIRLATSAHLPFVPLKEHPQIIT